jgi:7-carboxy-7-deazaguanine synthase
MKVNEIFYSIQGESSFAGRPCIFIRLTGCNLRCSYCDTEYAFYEGKDMSIPEILNEISGYDANLVLVTGGEPMLQDSVHELFQHLLGKEYTVLVETGGHMPLADIDPRVHKIMDIKCPSSMMSGRNNYGNIQYLTSNDEVKFVVGNREDFDWACEIIRTYDLASKAGVNLFSPVYGKLSYSDLANWILSCKLPVRMQIPLHKIIWPDISRGV